MTDVMQIGRADLKAAEQIELPDAGGDDPGGVNAGRNASPA